MRLTGNLVVDRRTKESRTVWRQRPRGTDLDREIMVMKQQQSRMKTGLLSEHSKDRRAGSELLGLGREQTSTSNDVEILKVIE